MGEKTYQDAYRLGKKEYKAKVSKGEFPYLPVLDEILATADIQTEQNMGLMHIPLDFVVGTSTMGRTISFAPNFMPIMEDGSEFQAKWMALSDAQVNEGIRDPIKCYEYLNRYYVVEGNKRVSVLKYYDAFEIPAMVTRKVPRYSDDPAIKLYYEIMNFNDTTGICSIEFTKMGMAKTILEGFGKTSRWDEKDRDAFNRVFFRFTNAYKFRGGQNLSITVGDAFAVFVDIYGYKDVAEMSEKDMNDYVAKVWKEFNGLTGTEAIGLVMNPIEIQEKKGLFSYFMPASKKTIKVAFMYPRTPEESDWVYGHELGRQYLADTFPDKIETISICNVTEDTVFEESKKLVDQNVDIIFQIAPQMMPQTLKFAAEHPQIKILNCSLNDPHQNIRTYYSRMFEAKFVTGLIAGAMAENDKVAYIADYPIYGMIANINAFALGVSATNPRAKIYLDWSTRKGFDREAFLKENDIHYISDQDLIAPAEDLKLFGLCKYENGQITNLAMPVWNWGVFYEKLIQSVLAGMYDNEGASEISAINYWWGMSAGVVDIICSSNVPLSVQHLAEYIRDDIAKDDLHPFYGQIYDQEGKQRNDEFYQMKPMEIMKMDYLVQNVIGSIPTTDELIDSARSVVELKGV